MWWRRAEQGFSLIELIAVVIIVGIIAAVGSARIAPTNTMQLHASRDTLLTVLLVAQQKAMVQNNAVQLIASDSQIDIRQDVNDNGVFSEDESIRFGGVTYPLTLTGNVMLTSATLDYDHLGRVTPTTLVLTQGSNSVTVTVTGTGYAY